MFWPNQTRQPLRNAPSRRAEASTLRPYAVAVRFMCHHHSIRKNKTGGLRLAAVGAVLLSSSVVLGQNTAVEPPVVVTHVDAVYPPSALAERRHADVILTVTVDADGHVSKVDIASSGGDDLDEAAIVAVRQWTFVPAKRNGVPVPSRIRIPFHFAPPAPPPEIVEPEHTEQPQLPPQLALPPAQGAAPETPQGSEAVTEVEIIGKRQPPSRGTSDFRIPRATLTAAPHGTAADLLSTAPGVFIAHPEGEAIAQRVFLRGFDAEHGQDVEFKLAGIPMNQQSHMHGQGYA